MKSWNELRKPKPHPKSAYAHLPMRSALVPISRRRTLFPQYKARNPKSFFRITRAEHEAYMRCISQPIPLMEK